MRKADYAALAAILRARIARATDSAARASTDADRDMYGFTRAQLIATARDFADIASVSRAEFLKACGIEP